MSDSFNVNLNKMFADLYEKVTGNTMPQDNETRSAASAFIDIYDNEPNYSKFSAGSAYASAMGLSSEDAQLAMSTIDAYLRELDPSMDTDHNGVISPLEYAQAYASAGNGQSAESSGVADPDAALTAATSSLIPQGMNKEEVSDLVSYLKKFIRNNNGGVYGGQLYSDGKISDFISGKIETNSQCLITMYNFLHAVNPELAQKFADQNLDTKKAVFDSDYTVKGQDMNTNDIQAGYILFMGSNENPNPCEVLEMRGDYFIVAQGGMTTNEGTNTIGIKEIHKSEVLGYIQTYNENAAAPQNETQTPSQQVPAADTQAQTHLATDEVEFSTVESGLTAALKDAGLQVDMGDLQSNILTADNDTQLSAEQVTEYLSIVTGKPAEEIQQIVYPVFNVPVEATENAGADTQTDTQTDVQADIQTSIMGMFSGLSPLVETVTEGINTLKTGYLEALAKAGANSKPEETAENAGADTQADTQTGILALFSALSPLFEEINKEVDKLKTGYLEALAKAGANSKPEETAENAGADTQTDTQTGILGLFSAWLPLVELVNEGMDELKAKYLDSLAKAGANSKPEETEETSDLGALSAYEQNVYNKVLANGGDETEAEKEIKKYREAQQTATDKGVPAGEWVVEDDWVETQARVNAYNDEQARAQAEAIANAQTEQAEARKEAEAQAEQKLIADFKEQNAQYFEDFPFDFDSLEPEGQKALMDQFAEIDSLLENNPRFAQYLAYVEFDIKKYMINQLKAGNAVNIDEVIATEKDNFEGWASDTEQFKTLHPSCFVNVPEFEAVFDSYSVGDQAYMRNLINDAKYYGASEKDIISILRNANENNAMETLNEFAELTQKAKVKYQDTLTRAGANTPSEETKETSDLGVLSAYEQNIYNSVIAQGGDQTVAERVIRAYRGEETFNLSEYTRYLDIPDDFTQA